MWPAALNEFDSRDLTDKAELCQHIRVCVRTYMCMYTLTPSKPMSLAQLITNPGSVSKRGS